MPRRPTELKYYPSRKAFFVQVDGRKILLAKGGKDDPEVLKRAKERFRAIVPERQSGVVAITDEEIEKVFKHASKWLNRILLILLYSGCRPKEGIVLTAEDLDRENQTLRIGARVMPCNGVFFELVTDLSRAVPTGPLICNSRGQPWTVDALHGSWIRLRDRLGLRKELTPFSLRHAFALRFLKCGGSITALAMVIGISEKQVKKLYQP